jgi:hypothetical protein
MKYTIAQFIPIILIFLLSSYSKSFVRFSSTILGKLLAVFIIIFYTFIDKLLGTFICLLILFYYQSDIVEHMLNMNQIENMENNGDDNNGDNNNDNDLDYLDNYLADEGDKKERERMMNYADVYGNDNILCSNDAIKEKFRKNNCVNRELINKGTPVNYEMTEHVFPEIKFRKGFCNPCLNTCEYSIIEQKIETENNLLRK